MKKYKIKLTDYEVSLLKSLLYERKNKLFKKFEECKTFNWSSAIKSAGIEAENLLIKFVKITKNSLDFYNYDIHPRSSFDTKRPKTYNEMLNDYFKEKKNAES